ncbi:hypothetical protein EYF80_017392 [Liparis tanakae]|uniref:Uncharacterized protein n=1 Tax=Liparis tanakae TaxID=230148 RepID=A0A4Z2I551_9TELE|nr:hypothetical protein EYF80_017392 [Liparis tanakae]
MMEREVTEWDDRKSLERQKIHVIGNLSHPKASQQHQSSDLLPLSTCIGMKDFIEEDEWPRAIFIFIFFFFFPVGGIRKLFAPVVDLVESVRARHVGFLVSSQDREVVLSLGIDGENPVQRNTHLLIGVNILKSQMKQTISITTKSKKYRHDAEGRVCLFPCSRLTVALLPKAA